MGTKRRNLLSWMLLGILFSSSILPSYSEVETIQTDRLFYTLDDTIIFSGTVDNDSSGLVTIVIRDSNDKFVLLTQALINPDNTFERSVDINEKFSIHGIYNATAFLVNMTEGSLTRFDFSLDGSPVNPSVMDSKKVINEEPVTVSQTSFQNDTKPEPVSKIASFVDPTKDPQYYIDRYNNEPAYKEWFNTNFPDLTIYEAVGLTINEEAKKIIDVSQFIDPEVDPQYYIDRYNNEPAYKEWFNTNFPDLTIYEAVGIIPEESTPKDIDKSNIIEPPVPTQESSPNLVESSAANTSIMTDTKNSEMGQMLLALGGLGILFGAVYGVKRKVDSNTEQILKNKSILQKKVESNTEQISQNSFWLKKKLMNLKQNDDPVKVIKDRLAKGEITVNEYYKLLKALKK
ncbi:MAG: hypothetical protein ACE5RN_00915 [Nitrosopumilaceae archaeon]